MHATWKLFFQTFSDPSKCEGIWSALHPNSLFMHIPLSQVTENYACLCPLPQSVDDVLPASCANKNKSQVGQFIHAGNKYLSA